MRISTYFNSTITYLVFHHDLLITKLYYIDHWNYTDGMHASWLPENLIILTKREDKAPTSPMSKST